MRGCVTDQHIEDGEFGMAKTCPLALSLKEILNEDIFVRPICIHWRNKNNEFQFCDLSDEIQKWIQDFDEDKDVKSFKYQVEDNFIRMIQW